EKSSADVSNWFLTPSVIVACMSLNKCLCDRLWSFKKIASAFSTPCKSKLIGFQSLKGRNAWTSSLTSPIRLFQLFTTKNRLSDAKFKINFQQVNLSWKRNQLLAESLPEQVSEFPWVRLWYRYKFMLSLVFLEIIQMRELGPLLVMLNGLIARNKSSETSNIKLRGKVWSRFRIVLREPYKDRNTKKKVAVKCNTPSSVESDYSDDEEFTSIEALPCPDSIEFRDQQCAAYNDLPYDDKLMTWVGYSGLDSPLCELWCQSDTGVIAKMAPSVKDGTRCRPGSLDLCVEGQCQKVGCDLMIGSEAKVDVCGICGGDGSTPATMRMFFACGWLYVRWQGRYPTVLKRSPPPNRDFCITDFMETDELEPSVLDVEFDRTTLQRFPKKPPNRVAKLPGADLTNLRVITYLIISNIRSAQNDVEEESKGGTLSVNKSWLKTMWFQDPNHSAPRTNHPIKGRATQNHARRKNNGLL
ncbi:unnamed protein product, partial [Nesidiocoris tenuis]